MWSLDVRKAWFQLLTLPLFRGDSPGKPLIYCTSTSSAGKWAHSTFLIISLSKN